MTTPTHNRPASFDLSREEAWVLHTALTSALDRALDAGETPRYARALVLQLESGETEFDLTARRFVADALATYLEDVPDRDAAIAARLLDRLRDTL
ncbi:DUF7853 family protein [Salinigranum salinum]|uniref:DUF7853 family protein n=1 Tax=Salinigranum salinum TaxID=1364937 RepID=UPI00126089F9|nr:hypothetical protein [Salinigranum salinum]